MKSQKKEEINKLTASVSKIQYQ